MFFEHNIISEYDLFRSIDEVDLLRTFQATSNSIMSRDIETPLRSRVLTFHREGSREYQPGDSMRMLVLRDLLNRDQLNVKTYYADTAFSIHIIIDPSPLLLNHHQTGPFALKLGLAFAYAALKKRQTVRVSFLGDTFLPLSKSDSIGELAKELSALQPQRIEQKDIAAKILEDTDYRTENCNLYFITHIGYRENWLDELFVASKERMKRTIIFPVLSIDEFDELNVAYAEGSNGFVRMKKNGNRKGVVDYLEKLVKKGESHNITVQPLVIENHEVDFTTAIDQLL